jgi:glutamyl-tRNA synthetase
VVDERGRRLAKRDSSISLASLRAAGVDPRALVTWAAHGAGMSVGEHVTARQALPAFDPARLPHAPVRFGRAETRRLRGA